MGQEEDNASFNYTEQAKHMLAVGWDSIAKPETTQALNKVPG